MNIDILYVRHGAVLIILGMISGITTMIVPAPSMALSAHTIGALQGTLAIALSVVWPFLAKNGHNLKLTKIMIVIGFYSNWLGAQLAGFWSAKKMAVVTGDQMPDIATQTQEVIVSVLLNISILVPVGFIYLFFVLTKLLNDGSKG